MKSLTKLMAMGLLSVGLAACSSDDEALPQGGQNLGNSDNVYMALNLSFPQSRSNTDEGIGQSNSNATPDVEVGVGEENVVTRMDIFLVDPLTGEIQGKGYAVPNTDGTLVGANGSYVAKFDGKELPAEKQVKVYVVCNGAPEMGAKDATFDVTAAYAPGVQSAPWHPFIMSNAKQTATITTPTAVEMATKHSDPSNPFQLGVVEVERAAARFDYMSTTDDLYRIQENFNQGDGSVLTKEFVNVQLTDLSVLNVSKQEYVFRHVGSDLGVVSGVCMPEVPTNYVITPDWVSNPTANLEANCWNSRSAQFNDKNAVKYVKLTAPMRAEDNWTPTDELVSRTDYKPMAYSSEVTSTKSPQNQQVSAIVFRGKLVAGAECPANVKTLLESTSAQTEKLYAYGNKVYGEWKDVKTAATAEGANELLKAAFNQVVEKAQKAAELAGTPENVVITNELAVEAGFTVYTQNPETLAYDVYYYYENRHNDLGSAQLASAMRYGVVRNNVYKLKVNKIAKYGHPFDKGGDPDPYKPEEKVDPENVYFEVAVKVLPWTVRVNDIEF